MTFRRIAFVAAAFFTAIPAFAVLPSSNEIAVDVPFDGGGMLMFAHDYRVARYVRVGLLAGAGEIIRRPTVRMPDGQDVEARIQSTVLPFIGPRITLATPVVGLSLGFAAFHARTETEINSPGQGTFSGSVSGWGTGFHAPFLELEFASSKRDLVFGFGLGGFFSTSFRKLQASGASGDITLNESPINTLTGRIKLVWGFGRVRAKPEDDDL